MLLANTVISSGAACPYGADGKRFDETLSREISCLNASCTIRMGDFSTPVEMTKVGDGVSVIGGVRFLHSATVEMTIGVPAANVISSGAARRYGW